MPAAYLGFPPFSPTLIAGFLARPLPLAPLNLLLGNAVRHMHSQHPDVFDRMRIIENPTFLIVPTDLPFLFFLNVDSENPVLKAVRPDVYANRAANEKAAATICGPLSVLISLMEGKIDGDALFFTRALTFKGDTEAVLALRNAVDGAEIDLRHDTEKIAGPFLARLASPLTGLFARAWQRGNNDLGLVARALTGGHEKRLTTQENAIETLQQQVKTLVKSRARKQA